MSENIAAVRAMPKLVVLFDLWRTLARGPYPEPVKELKEILGLDESHPFEDFLEHCLTIPHKEVKPYLKELGQRLKLHRLPGEKEEAQLSELVQSERSGFWLYSEVLSELEWFKKQKVTIGLVTNCWPFALDELLVRTKLDRFFDVGKNVVSSHLKEVAKQKGPDFYRMVAEHFGVQPKECVMVGDNPHLDIVPAHHAGMRTVLIDRDGQYPEGHPLRDAVSRFGAGYATSLSDLRAQFLERSVQIQQSA